MQTRSYAMLRITGFEHPATKADVAGLEGCIDRLESRLDVLQWIVGIQSAMILAIALRVFALIGP